MATQEHTISEWQAAQGSSPGLAPLDRGTATVTEEVTDTRWQETCHQPRDQLQRKTRTYTPRPQNTGFKALA